MSTSNKLKEYYENLPEKSNPKTDFVNQVAFRANVSTNTVRNWIDGTKPANPKHINIISEITGISAEELFNA